jgi:hypothetical protein
MRIAKSRDGFGAKLVVLVQDRPPVLGEEKRLSGLWGKDPDFLHAAGAIAQGLLGQLIESIGGRCDLDGNVRHEPLNSQLHIEQWALRRADKADIWPIGIAVKVVRLPRYDDAELMLPDIRSQQHSQEIP